MPKINRTISVDVTVWQLAKEADLNVSKICEKALREATQKEDSYEELWAKQAKIAEQEQYVVQLREVREIEKQCVTEDRHLWNETYRILKESGTLPVDVVQRVKKRAALFKEMKEARE